MPEAFAPGIVLAQSCKPDSVSAKGGHASFIWVLRCRSTLAAYPLRVRTSSPSAPLARSYRNLFGLATRKVYHAFDVATKPVSSYLTFSPFPHKSEVVSLSVALSVPGKPRPSR